MLEATAANRSLFSVNVREVCEKSAFGGKNLYCANIRRKRRISWKMRVAVSHHEPQKRRLTPFSVGDKCRASENWRWRSAARVGNDIETRNLQAQLIDDLLDISSIWLPKSAFEFVSRLSFRFIESVLRRGSKGSYNVLHSYNSMSRINNLHLPDLLGKWLEFYN